VGVVTIIEKDISSFSLHDKAAETEIHSIKLLTRTSILVSSTRVIILCTVAGIDVSWRRCHSLRFCAFDQIDWEVGQSIKQLLYISPSLFFNA
jgi:hypothetical protein